MDLEKVESLLKLMREYRVSEYEHEADGQRLRLALEPEGGVMIPAPMGVPMPAAGVHRHLQPLRLTSTGRGGRQIPHGGDLLPGAKTGRTTICERGRQSGCGSNPLYCRSHEAHE